LATSSIAPAEAPTRTDQELREFTVNYYHRGGRERLREALVATAGISPEAFGGDPHSRALGLYFFARVARLDPGAVPTYEPFQTRP
jgi:hypothetical protein